MMANKYTSSTIPLDSTQLRSARFTRADIQLHEVDHSGASYEGRIFLNNTEADENTPTEAESGYAGSFYIFSHGGCFGDVGHCELQTGIRPYDKRLKSPTVPRDISVTITDKLKDVVSSSNQFTVTIVPIVEPENYSLESYNVDLEHCLKFKNIDLRLYDAPDE
jgi:hypothetical protein